MLLLAKRSAVDIDQGFQLLDLGWFFLPHLDDVLQRGQIESSRARLLENILDVAAERLAFRFEIFDPFDNTAKPVRRDIPRARVVSNLAHWTCLQIRS